MKLDTSKWEENPPFRILWPIITNELSHHVRWILFVKNVKQQLFHLMELESLALDVQGFLFLFCS